MAKTKLNVELLKRLKTRFMRMRHPEHFNMNDYAQTTECGTAMCIAGHALDLQGYKLKGKESYLLGTMEFISPAGRKVIPEIAARRELGMRPSDARELFTDFDLETPKQAAARIQELIDSVEGK